MVAAVPVLVVAVAAATAGGSSVSSTDCSSSNSGSGGKQGYRNIILALVNFIIASNRHSMWKIRRSVYTTENYTKASSMLVDIKLSDSEGQSVPPAKPSSEIFSAAWICQAVEGLRDLQPRRPFPRLSKRLRTRTPAVEEAYKSTALAPMTPPAPERAESPELKGAL